MRQVLATLRAAGIVATAPCVLLLLVPGASGGGQDARAVVGPALDRAPREIAALVEPLGDAGRTTLVTMASSRTAETACGLAGLAAVRDPRGVPLLVAAIQAAPDDSEVWRLVRWAAFVAGGPDPAVGTPLVGLLGTLRSPTARAAAGDDLPRLLGELDTEAARDLLVAALDSEDADATIDAVIHALARQGEPRARARVLALAEEVARGLAGNATFEQARRLGSAAFYLLALGDETHAAGLRLFTWLSPADQADTAAWSVQTLCERAVRRPAAAVVATAQRTALVDAFSAAGVRWEHLARGSFSCLSVP